MGIPISERIFTVFIAIEEETTHLCGRCKQNCICTNKNKYHFCSSGYHGLCNTFVCNNCLKY